MGLNSSIGKKDAYQFVDSWPGVLEFSANGVRPLCEAACHALLKVDLPRPVQGNDPATARDHLESLLALIHLDGTAWLVYRLVGN